MTKDNSNARRETRREEAKGRQSQRDGRSRNEQLDLLKKRPGESKREREKLLN